MFLRHRVLGAAFRDTPFLDGTGKLYVRTSFQWLRWCRVIGFSRYLRSTVFTLRPEAGTFDKMPALAFGTAFRDTTFLAGAGKLYVRTNFRWLR
jgi:ribosomal protein L24E